MKAPIEDMRKAQFELLVREARAGNFLAYCLFMDAPFFLKRKILFKIIEAFQSVHDAFKRGESISVACSLPPRAGKSYITSLFVTFMLGHFPNESVMRNACTGTLYNKFSYDAREIVKKEQYRMVFPDVRMSRKQNLGGWSLESAKQVSYFGAGVSGTIIGFGASMLSITDDLFKDFEAAMSATINDTTWRWKEGAHDSRTEKNCCKIDIGTRWSMNDVIGRMEANGEYDIIVRIPALIEDEDSGEMVSFCEDVHSTDYYLKLQATIDQMIFMAEYMQDPIEVAGLLYPKSELNFFTMAELAGKNPDGKVGAVDVADEGTDYLSNPIGYIFGDKVFITDWVYNQSPVEVNEGEVAGKIIEHQIQNELIESNNGGRLFSIMVDRILKQDKQDNKTKHQANIEARPTVSNKMTRMIMRAGIIKKHFYFRSDVPLNSEYAKAMHDLTTFLRTGGNAHDDAPDGITILAEYLEYLGVLSMYIEDESQRSADVKREFGFY